MPTTGNETGRTLDEIARFHQADKASHYHGYTRWYEKHFAPYVGKQFTLLEIGIAYSFSLLTWREYFGRQARIVGLDIDADFCTQAAGKGFETKCGDALDAAFLTRVIDEIQPDIVIDDGNHHAEHQRVAFHTIFPKLKPGSLYVVEDLHAAYWKWGGEFIPDLYALVDKVNHTGKLSLGWAKNEPEKQVLLDPLELTVSAMHFYPSIVFIEKADKTK